MFAYKMFCVSHSMFLVHIACFLLLIICQSEKHDPTTKKLIGGTTEFRNNLGQLIFLMPSKSLKIRPQFLEH